MTTRTPAPPPGFVLENRNDLPAPPPGFVIDGPAQTASRDTFAGRLDTVARGAADLMSFGMADEIAAAGDALLHPVFGTGTPGESIGDRYTANLARQREIDRSDSEDRFGYRLAGQIGGGVSNAVGIAKAGGSLAANAAQAGKGWYARLLGGAADGGIAAGLYGAGSGESMRDRLVTAAQNVPLGAALGAAGEGTAMALGAGLKRAFRGADDVGRGVNPAANVDDARQFGIPLSRAQATRSIPQANIENQLRSQGRMGAFDQAQREAVEQSIGGVQGRIAGNRAPIPGPASAYDNVPGKLRAIRDGLKAASQDAYDASVNNADVLVSGDAVRALPQFVRRSLDENQILIDPMYHQGAARALKFIDDYIGRLPEVPSQPTTGTRMLSSPAGEVRDVAAQLRWIENLRAGIRKNFPPIGQDAPALKAITRALDDWTDDVFERGLVNADDEVLEALKAARAKWSAYKSMADPKAKLGGKLNPHYEAQRAVRNIMDKDMSPEEVGQYLFGSSVASPKNTAFMTAQELKRLLGPDSAEWSAIRQSFWLRATRASDEVLSPARIAKNLDGFTKGQGASVAKALYSAEELALMSRYAGVMRNLTPAREGLNGSNTANRLMPALARYGAAIMGALTGGGGMASGMLDPLSAIGLGAATTGIARGMGSIANASRAATAVRMPVPPVPSGMGGAALRGGSLPMVEGRKPLELTVRP